MAAAPNPIVAPLPPPAEALPARLDRLFFINAEAYPDRLALVDDADRLAWNKAPPLRLTYRDAARRVKALAGALQRGGLKSGDVVAIRPPNTVEAVLFILAAWRLGLIVAPIPPVWDKHECLTYLPELRPAALVSAGIDGDQAIGQQIRDIANGVLTVRHMLGIGGDLPPSVRSLTPLMDANGFDGPDGPDDDRIATISMTEPAATGRPRFIARCHSHWAATGLMVSLAPDRAADTTFLTPLAIDGYAGMASVLVPWLAAAGTLHLHRFAGISSLVDQIATIRPDRLVLPGAFAEAAIKHLRAANTLPGLTVAVWRDRHPDNRAPLLHNDEAGRLADLITLDDLAMVAQRHSALGGPVGVPLGRAQPLSEDTDPGGSPLLEIRIDGSSRKAGDRSEPLLGGRIAVAGAMVPNQARLTLAAGPVLDTGLTVGEDGFVRTGITCRVADGKPPRAVAFGRDRDHIVVHGLPVAVPALDEIYAAHHSLADAAAVAVARKDGRRRLEAAIVLEPDQTLDLAEFKRFLRERSVAEHHMPAALAPVEMIPRGASGAVLRDILEDRLKRDG